MTSLNDIPFVGNVVQRIEDAAIDSATLRLRYLLCYKSLVKGLKIEVGKLKIEEDAMSRKAGEERDNGKVIKDHVLKWQQDVEDIQKVVECLFESYESRPSWMCFKDIPFAKPVSRFRLGKQAAEGAKTVTELTNLGANYRATTNEIAHHPPKENLPISDTTYQIFPSRQEAYGKLWEALIKEDGHPILGIYGMPGVGKTRMMEQAWQEAKEKGFFSKVTRADVGSDKIDVIKLQHQIAGYLDCHLESKDTVENRASQLKQSLMNGGKTLVILDDVWDVIPLNKIGIPFGNGRSKGCKILFTSRSPDVCRRNNCEDPISIETLTEDEAWRMFEEAVGTSKIISLREPLLADNVCNKCGRLPLLINAVGNALKFMTEDSWKDALYTLTNGRYTEIAGVDPEVYGCIKLSFEKLTEAGKTCLLLCSLFPDADINIKDLSNLATGSRLLDQQRNIAGVVDLLKLSSLLLPGKDDVNVKVHDIIRDVAKNIAATDPKYRFLSIRCRLGWPDYTDYHTVKLLHLDMGKVNVSSPNDLECPDLHTLVLECDYKTSGLVDGTFQELMELRFLLQGMSFPEQQLSIHRLEKLRMISIKRCDIDQTSFSSIPQTLQTLCIEDCALPSPLDLSKLKNLRKLELVDRNVIKMVPNSISSLTRLEELIIPLGVSIWEDGDADDARSIYVELNKLTRLRNLTIRLPYSQSCLNGDTVSNLQEFKIIVGSLPNFVLEYLSEKSFIFKGNHIQSGWMTLVERAEEVYLMVVEGLSNDSNLGEAFTNLKNLTIEDCADMDHLVRLPVVGRNQRLAYFSNLCFLNISKCQGLTYLFPASVAKCLQNIQKLTVFQCHAIEEIVRVDYGLSDDGEVIISFPKLKYLWLSYLSRLASFSPTHKVTFPSLEELNMYSLDSASEIWKNVEDSSSFSQLKVLKVEGCNKLENVIPFTLDHEFNNLEEIDIMKCQSLKTVFQGSTTATDMGNLNQTEGRRVVFSSLKELYLRELPNIKSFWSYDGETLKLKPNHTKVSFPILKDFRIFGSETNGLTEQTEVGIKDDSPSKLMSLLLHGVYEVQFLPSQWRLQLQNLYTLSLRNFMWHPHSLFNSTTLTLNRFTELTLDNCEFGPALFTISCFRSFQQLKRLKVHNCSLLEEIVEEDIGIDVEKTISLPSLRSLDLGHLPSLKSFSQSSSYAFNMPALYSIYLNGCPLMDKFTSLPISTPLLERYNRRRLPAQISDLNSYVREKVSQKH